MRLSVVREKNCASESGGRKNCASECVVGEKLNESAERIFSCASYALHAF